MIQSSYDLAKPEAREACGRAGLSRGLRGTCSYVCPLLAVSGCDPAGLASSVQGK